MKKRKLTPDEIAERIEQLETGEIPEDASDFDPWNRASYRNLYPETLCVHGIRRELCYPCTPLEGGENERKTLPGGSSVPDDLDSDPF